MTYYHFDEKRETDPYALPDLEVFYANTGALDEHEGRDEYDEPSAAGWYWWPCFPGCLPDGDAVGPFATEAEALQDARDQYGDCED